MIDTDKMGLKGRTKEDIRLSELLSGIRFADAKAMQQARIRWDHVAKPLHSLGVLEDQIVRSAGVFRTSHVTFDKRALLIMCADNGVVEEGITQTGQEVTAIVTENMTKGASSVCLMARRADVDVFPVDIGVAATLTPGTIHPLTDRKIAYGTRNFCKEPAMTREEALRAILTGIDLVQELAGQGYNLLATGEMGIGNTTTSSAVASMLLNCLPKEMTGRGAGLHDAGLCKKILVISEAVKRYGPECMDAVDVLAHVGGFDIAGLTGVFLGGAVCGIPVLLDGFISGTAALAASLLCPAATDYMLASHVSAEPAGRLILQTLGLKPVIEAGLCLGEGTGAVASVPLLDMALDIYREMSTFEEISVEQYEDYDSQEGLQTESRRSEGSGTDHNSIMEKRGEHLQ